MVYFISVNEDAKKTNHGSYSLLREILNAWGFEGGDKKILKANNYIYIQLFYSNINLNFLIFNSYFEFIFESNVF